MGFDTRVMSASAKISLLVSLLIGSVSCIELKDSGENSPSPGDTSTDTTDTGAVDTGPTDTDTDTDTDTGSTDTDTDTDTDTTTPKDKDHDCLEYEPTVAGGDLSGEWNDHDDVDDYTITAPSDPGGGVVQVTLTSDFMSPWLALNHASHPSSPPSILDRSAEGFADPSRIIAEFEVAANESYTITAAQAIALDGFESYPVEYTMSWSFSSKVDCYEPNDDVKYAKQVPINTTLSAYALGGYRSDYLHDDDVMDWYSFTLTETSEVVAAFADTAPVDLWLAMDIYPPKGGILDGGSSVYGVFSEPKPITLEPGIYHLRVDAFYSPGGVVIQDDVPPDHWSTEYGFEVRASAK